MSRWRHKLPVVTMAVIAIVICFASLAHIRRSQRSIALRYEISDLRRQLQELQEERLDLERRRAQVLEPQQLRAEGEDLGLMPPKPLQFRELEREP